MIKSTFKQLALLLAFMLILGTCFVSCTQNETDNTITIWAYDAYAEAATKAVEI